MNILRGLGKELLSVEMITGSQPFLSDAGLVMEILKKIKLLKMMHIFGALQKAIAEIPPILWILNMMLKLIYQEVLLNLKIFFEHS